MTEERTPPTVHEMTVMALMEAGHRAAAKALEQVPPTDHGHPRLGWMGWMDQADVLALAKAAILAHEHAGEPLDRDCPDTPDGLARALKERVFTQVAPAENEFWVVPYGDEHLRMSLMRAYHAYDQCRHGGIITNVTA